MKKLLALMLAAALALSLVACGGDSGAGDTNTPSGGNGDTTGTDTPSTTSPYADMESCAEYAIDELKSVLKNPSSLIVNNLYAVEADDGYIFNIDYSAENSLGGMNRDNFFIAVYSIENGFGVNTYGTGTFSEAENQHYSSQFFDKFNKVSGSYIFDPETLTVLGIDESGIDPYIDERIELTGKMKGEKDASTGYGGAWDFELNNDPYLKVVYFAEGTDLSWYEHFTGLPYEITISAIKGEDGHYREAEIVEDTVRDTSNDVRIQRFNFYDRKSLALAMPDSGIEPMSAEDMQAVFTDATFSMRENESEDTLRTITFHAGGTVGITGSDGQETTKYESWKIENGSIICTHNFTVGDLSFSNDYIFMSYPLDEARYLLINITDPDSMILTPQ